MVVIEPTFFAASHTTTVVKEVVDHAVADWLTAAGTVGAAIAAIALGLGFKEWVFRPRLRIRFSAQNISDRVVTLTLGGHPAAYVRVRVGNGGRSTAKRVWASLLEVESWHTERGWERRWPELDGATLAWSNREPPVLDIPPKSERPLDLFAVFRDFPRQGRMPIVLQIRRPFPANRAHELNPGGWRIRIEAAADNATPETYYVAFRFDGSWPARSFWDAVAVDGPSKRPQARPPVPDLRDPAEMLAEAAQHEEEASQHTHGRQPPAVG